jgi:hypothetical protein
VSFDGVDDRVTVADTSSLDLTGPLTVTAWVRPTSLGAWRPVLLKEPPTGITHTLYATNPANWPNARLDIGGTDRPVWGGSAMAQNTWTHLAVTYDRAAR